MTAPARLSVLIVDDHPDAGDSCAELLRLMGHDARVVRTGADALRVATGTPPDVALLELGLPDMDGYSLAETLIATLTRRPALVAVTGYGNLEEKARAAGFDYYLLKPVEPAVLADLLARRAAATDRSTG